MEDKNFLQSIKLEISKNFQLDPYERVAFHRILSHLQTDSDKKILIKELDKEGFVRVSAIISLSKFDDPELVPVLISSISEKSTVGEIIAVLNFLKKNGSESEISYLLDLLEKMRDHDFDDSVVLNIFEVLRVIGNNNAVLFEFIEKILQNPKENKIFLMGAFNTLSSFRNVKLFEKYAGKNDDDLYGFVFQSIYKLNINTFDPLKKSDEIISVEERYVEKPLSESEELLLSVKVFLGKCAGKFEDFINDTKVAYINALLSCNHRESSIYLLKALESNDGDLISMTLYSLYNNINRLNLPEKLFRSLTSMNVESDQDNDLIIEIIVQYFSEKSSGRSNSLFQDKEFGFFAATLESYFETYRREFMIPDVVENTFPENFKKVRDFILRKINPECKRKLLNFLYTKGSENPRKMIDELDSWVHYIKPEDDEKLSIIIDLLLDEDPVSRENSANRIDSVNFEKRYLQSKIIRLCNIISSLNIVNASKSLVFIYNYLKKYPEPEIYEAVTFALCRLNYSYMLSEVEIMLSAGSPEDQKDAVRLLGLFTEKRLINILIEYLNSKASVYSEIVREITVIVSGQDIKKKINVSEVLKKLIENNEDFKTRKYAILGLGKCSFPDDIEYLHELFIVENDSKIKESIVKSISSILKNNEGIKKQKLLKSVNEYLKDSSIKVRIFSCIILIQLGKKEALKSIRDMLIIKNKSIQREILSILREVEAPDFYFFLVSLLRSEYGISQDIIGILKRLPNDELKEIDNFILNLFRKYELPDIGISNTTKEVLNIDGLEEKEKSVLFIKNKCVENDDHCLDSSENLKWNILIDSLLLPSIKEYGGIISNKINHDMSVIFDDPEMAVKTAMAIKLNLQGFNRKTVLSKNVCVRMSIVTDVIGISNDEIFTFFKDEPVVLQGIPVKNRILIEDKTAKKLEEKYHYRSVPEILYSHGLSSRKHYEILSINNFKFKALEILDEKFEKRKDQVDLEKHIQEQVKSLSSQNRSKTSISIASELEDIGVKMNTQFREIEKYVIGRSTDRELTRNVGKMLNNIYDLYRIEISKLIIK